MMDITELSLRQVIDELETGRARVEDAIELALSRLKDAIAAPVLCQKCAAREKIDGEIDGMIRTLPPQLAIIVRALNGKRVVGAQELAEVVFKSVPGPRRPLNPCVAIQRSVKTGRPRLHPFGWDIRHGNSGRGYQLVKITTPENHREDRNG